MKYYGKITDQKDLTTKEFVEGHHDDTKQNTLVSGTNIKTINNNSILTSGNINASEVSVAATGTATDEVQYITIDGVEKKLAGGGGAPQWIEIYSITSVCDGVIASASNPTGIEAGQTVTLTYTAGTKPLPMTITVTNASYTWTRATGTAEISNPTGDITVTVTGLEEWDTNPVTTEEATNLGYTWTEA